MTGRLFAQIVSLEVRKTLTYRTDLGADVVSGLVAGFVIPYFLWSSVFASSGAERVAGYTLPGLLLYYAAVTLLGKVIRGPDMVEGLAEDVYRGGLNRYLVFPTRYVPFRYAMHVGGTTLPVVQLVLLLPGLVWWAGHSPEGAAIGVVSVAQGVSLMAVAHALYFLIGYPIQGVAFWAEYVWSLSVLLRFVSYLLGGVLLPLALFPEGVQAALQWTPFPYLYDAPVRAFLGQLEVWEWARGLGVGVVWCGVFRWVGDGVWARGRLRYSGVGI